MNVMMNSETGHLGAVDWDTISGFFKDAAGSTADIITAVKTGQNSGGSSTGNYNPYGQGGNQGSSQSPVIVLPQQQASQAGIGTTGAVAIGVGFLAIMGLGLYAVTKSSK